MKKIKKILAAVMVSAMVLGMSMTTMAAENTNVTITVTDVAEGTTLYYDQIASANTGAPYGWEYTGNYEGAFTNLDIDDLITIVQNNESGDATTGELTTSSDLAAILESIRDTVIGQNKEITNANHSFPVNASGLYVVVPVNSNYTYTPTLVYVPFNQKGNIDVTTKGSENQVRKTVKAGGESVSPGDIIQYEVSFEYPYIAASYENATFTITDKLTNATLYYDATHPVTVTNINEQNYTMTPVMGASELVIDFSNYDIKKAGTQVTVTYYVKVNEELEGNSEVSNEVTSNLDLDPDDGDDTETIYKVVSKPVNATIDKVDDETSTKLPGSVFAIYEGIAGDDTSDTLISIMADAENTDGITLPDEYQGYADLLEADGTANGTITFSGLNATKDYYVVEIIAPEGYQIDGVNHQLIKGELVSAIEDKVGNTITKTYVYDDFKVNQENNNITNTKLSSLPETGGIGTTIFTIGGCIIMIAAAGLFFASRRKSSK